MTDRTCETLVSHRGGGRYPANHTGDIAFLTAQGRIYRSVLPTLGIAITSRRRFRFGHAGSMFRVFRRVSTSGDGWQYGAERSY
jgi:hypothetical protein